MTRLTATDAMFAYAHTPQVPMNMGSVQILSLPKNYKGDYFTDFKAFMAERLDYLPKLKKRLVIDTIGLPSWLDVDDFDLDYHIRRTHVRSDDEKELAKKLGRIQHVPFDFDKPLFMFYVIEGLKDSQIAVVQKFHHTLADGKTAVRMMDLFSDEGLERARLAQEHDEDLAGSSHNVMGRLLAGCVDDVRRSVGSLSGLAGAARKLVSSGGRDMMERLSARPATIFNQPLSEKRLFAVRHWPLDDVNTVRKSAGLTFNDMGLALLGGALRRYMDELDVLPEQSLVCNVPVALKVKGSESGNAVLAIWVPFGTHLADPKERIAYMKAEADQCKGFLTELLEAASVGKGIKLPSFFMRMMALPMSSQWLSQQSPPPGNVALSNVPSPTKHIHVAGARVESLYGMPMLLQAQAISCTFSSYAGQVVASILCCEEALPDPERLFAYMDDELKLLKKLYVKPAKKAARKRRTK